MPETPLVTADVIIHDPDRGVLLIRRRNPPHGWALPGGFVDPGERLDEAARREATEETSLTVTDLVQFATYSDPNRDPRGHTVSTVYLARAEGTARAADDAADLAWHPLDALPETAFDHGRILAHYRHFLTSGERPRLP